MKIERFYGKERNIGDVLYNANTKAVIANIDGGFFGKMTLTLKKEQDNTFTFLKPYIDKNGIQQVVKIGKLFPVKKKNGDIVEGLHKGIFGLNKEYDRTIEKEIIVANDCLIVTIHKLKVAKLLSNNWMKIGWITGLYAIEKNIENNTIDTNDIIDNEYISNKMTESEMNENENLF